MQVRTLKIKKMDLVSKEAFQELIDYKRFGKDIFTDIVFQVLKLNKVNNFYNKHHQKSADDFINELIDYLEIQYQISEQDLERIPAKGSFVIISNHPFGALDGILLYKIISEIRPDFKVMANFLLQKIEPLKDCFFPVNPFETRRSSYSNHKGLRNALNHVIEEHPLGIFPAGEVSTYNIKENRIADKEWNKNIIKFIVNCESPIIPVFISGTNSALFHALGRIHPMLRTAQLPSELFNKKDKKVTIRIGNQIRGSEIEKFDSFKDLGRFLRAKTYSLGNSLDVDSFYKKPLLGARHIPQIIIDAVDNSILNHEISQLKQDGSLLFEMNNYSVFCAKTEKIPNIIIEIGRLREITFREINEGTNKSIDLDGFDVYYNHLIIWDNTRQRIVGSYRIGKGKEIMEEFGIKGFYIRSLFKINRALYPVFEQSLELGRSFIVKDYQKKAMPLFLLWKGIFYFLMQHKEYRYLTGPVSISNSFSNFSKSLIVSFIHSHYYDENMAQFVKPRKRFVIPQKHMPEIDCLVEESTNDIERIDSIVYELEHDKRIPVLLKKYLSLNAKIIGFNIDPLFNNCLDGLILLDLLNVPQQIVESFSKDLQDESSKLSKISLLRE